MILVKPGPTDTPMTAHLKRQGASLAPVESVSADIITAIGASKFEVYTPPIWRLLMLVIYHLPRCIFQRLNI